MWPLILVFIWCQSATEEELVVIMSILGELSVCRTNTGRQQLADLLMAQVDLTKPLLKSPDISKTVGILNQAKNFFSVSIVLLLYLLHVVSFSSWIFVRYFIYLKICILLLYLLYKGSFSSWIFVRHFIYLKICNYSLLPLRFIYYIVKIY